MVTQSTRTAQDLLAERRATVCELARERDKTARAMLTYQIKAIDHQLADARAEVCR